MAATVVTFFSHLNAHGQAEDVGTELHKHPVKKQSACISVVYACINLQMLCSKATVLFGL